MQEIILWAVDPQRDFMLRAGTDAELERQGRLYVPDSESIIPNITNLRDDAKRHGLRILGHADEHDENTPELVRNKGKYGERALWQDHCMEGTEGQRYIPEALLAEENVGTVHWKEKYPPKQLVVLLSMQQVILTKDTYSVFESPHILELMKTVKPGSDIFVFGVATEYCVAESVRGLAEWARKNDSRVFIVADAIKEITPEGKKSALVEFEGLGVGLVATHELQGEIAKRYGQGREQDLKVAIAQINTSAGDIELNTTKIIHYIERAKSAGANLVVFPEMAVPGYPPKDLLLSGEFVLDCLRAQERIRLASKGIAVIVGGIEKIGKRLRNAALVFKDGEKLYSYHKRHLPNYDVFDEKRYFEPGKLDGVFMLDGRKIGISVCEDIWVGGDLINRQSREGAELLVNISASPFHLGKTEERQKVISERASTAKAAIAYANQVGGQDDIVFDGESYAFNAKGQLIARGKHFSEDLVLFSLADGPIKKSHHGTAEEAYEALKTGLRDYFEKSKAGFRKAVLGLSGGIDSALTATIAADALGSEKVVCISMPSRFTSEQSIKDARALAFNLKVDFKEIGIDGIYDAYMKSLGFPENGAVTVAQENIQARIRANILFKEANSENYLVLNTSNKSEAAVGYGTIYGDMAGGFAVISDVPKTLVYTLAYYVNRRAGNERIPLNIIHKFPSAELKPGQRDLDSLPPYEKLDPVVHSYVEEVKSPRKIARELKSDGIDREMVLEVIRRIDAAEFKRKQSPPGTKITPRAFGTGRRMPIANGFTNR